MPHEALQVLDEAVKIANEAVPVRSEAQQVAYEAVKVPHEGHSKAPNALTGTHEAAKVPPEGLKLFHDGLTTSPDGGQILPLAAIELSRGFNPRPTAIDYSRRVPTIDQKCRRTENEQCDQICVDLCHCCLRVELR